MLELSNVHAGYGETTVLRDVSLSVPDSTVVALLGPNGAGKTTTLRVVSGLIRPAEGQVRLDGEDVSQRKPFQRTRRGLCHIPEGRGVYPSLTVRDNIILSAFKGAESAAVARAVDVFPILGSKLKLLAGELSGGQQQMLAFVRAYVQNPRLVLVDEASMGLAPVVIDEIFDFLAKIALDGTSLLVVEQYVSRALAIADQVYLMNKGRIVFGGAPSDVGDDLYAHYLGAAAGAH